MFISKTYTKSVSFIFLIKWKTFNDNDGKNKDVTLQKQDLPPKTIWQYDGLEYSA